jgi:hypothetical protein
MVQGTPEIKLHPGPLFEAKKGHFSHLGLPDPPLRMGFIGVSGSGKGVAMLDLLLRHYRGCFERIYLYSPSASIDKGWDALRKYVEEEHGVDQSKEKTFFDEFDSKALQEQVSTQMRVAELAKTRGMTEIPQVLWIFDDFADDERIMHNNHNTIASLAIRSRHYGGNLFVASQKYRALANVVRVNLTALFIWPAPNVKERKAVIEELAGHHSEKDIEEMLQYIARKPHAFLFANLKAKNPDDMFMDSLTSRIRVTKKAVNDK